jgi:flagellar hook-associated protein 3 FlgL
MEPIRRNPLAVADLSSRRLLTIEARMQRAETEAVTGVRIHKPSDAPAETGALHGWQAEKGDQEVWSINADLSLTYIDAAESALGDGTNILRRATELAVQLGSDIYNQAERDVAAAEVDSLRENLLKVANTRIGERAVFGGVRWNVSPFDATGAYIGDAAEPEVNIARGVSVKMGFDGRPGFTSAIDSFKVLEDLATSLRAGDTTAVRNSLDDLRTATKAIIEFRTEMGVYQAEAIDAGDTARRLSAFADTQLYRIAGADPATAFNELINLRTSYEAALKVVAGQSANKLFDLL